MTGRRRLPRPILMVGIVVLILLAGSVAAVAYTWPRGEGQRSTASLTDLAQAAGAFTCGERLDLSTARTSRGGVTVAVSEVREQSEHLPPVVYATYSADHDTAVVTTPPQGIALVVLRGDAVVAHTTPPASDAATPPPGLPPSGYRLEVPKSAPAQVQLTRAASIQLCPGVTWPMVWSGDSDYKIMALVPELTTGDRASSSADGPLMPYISLPQR